MLRLRWIATSLATFAVMLGGCGITAPTPSGPYGETATVDAELMSVEPEEPAPGARFEVHLGAEEDHVTGFVLERRTDDGWLWQWTLINPTPETARDQNIFTAEEFLGDNVQWEEGSGPREPRTHHLRLPDQLEPGRWRICTPDDDALCANFIVIENDGQPDGAVWHLPEPQHGSRDA